MDRPDPMLPPPRSDPEFGPVTEFREALPAGVAPESYLRVVANPFLAFAGLVGWLSVTRWIGRESGHNPDLIGPLAPFLVAVLLVGLRLIGELFQFHCLDCGATGWLSRWRAHQCPRSDLRRVLGRRRWPRGPTPFFQILLWMWTLLLVALAMGRDRLGLWL